MGYNGKLPGRDEVAKLIIDALRQDKRDVVINADIVADIDQKSFQDVEDRIEEYRSEIEKPVKIAVDTKDAKKELKDMDKQLKAFTKKIKNNLSSLSTSDMREVLSIIDRLKDVPGYSDQIRDTFSDISADFRNFGTVFGLDDVLDAFEESASSLRNIDWGFGKLHDKNRLIEDQKEIIDQLKQIGKLRYTESRSSSGIDILARGFDEEDYESRFSTDELQDRIELLEQLRDNIQKYAKLTRTTKVSLFDDGIYNDGNFVSALDRAIQDGQKYLNKFLREQGDVIPSLQNISNMFLSHVESKVDLSNMSRQLREEVEKYIDEILNSKIALEDAIDEFNKALEVDKFELAWEDMTSGLFLPEQLYMKKQDLAKQLRDSIVLSAEDMIETARNLLEEHGVFNQQYETIDDYDVPSPEDFLAQFEDYVNRTVYVDMMTERLQRDFEFYKEAILDGRYSLEEAVSGFAKDIEVDKMYTAWEDIIDGIEIPKRLQSMPQEYASRIRSGATEVNDAIYYMSEAIDELRAESMEDGWDDLDDLFERENKAIESVKKVTDLMANLSSQYGEGTFSNVFGDMISSFGKIDGSNAAELYDVLIAKNQEYQNELIQAEETRKRVGKQTKMFVEDNNSLLQSFENNGKFLAQYTGLLEQVSNGTLLAADASEQLRAAVKSLNDVEVEQDKVVEKKTSKKKKAHNADGKISQKRTADNELVSELLENTGIDKLLKGLNIPKDEIAAFKKEFIELGAIMARGEDSTQKYENLFDNLIKSGSIIERNNRIYEDFYEFMSGRRIRYDDSIKAEFGDDWIPILNRYRKVLTKKNDQTISAPDQLYEELLSRFPEFFDKSIINEKDQLRRIIEVFDAARLENKQPKTSKVQIPDSYLSDISVDYMNVVNKMWNNVLGTTQDFGDELFVIEQEEEKIAESAQKINKELDKQKETAEEIKRLSQDSDIVSEKSKDNKPQPVDINEKSIDDALKQLRNASYNKTAFIDLTGVESVDDLEEQVRNMAQLIVGSDLKVGSVVVQDDIARITLYNEQLGITASQMWSLRESTEEAEKAQLSLISETKKYDRKAAQKYSEAQQKKIDDADRWLISQMAALDKQELSYKHSGKKISGDTEIFNFDDKYFGKTIDELASDIRERITATMGGALTEPVKNEIKDALRVLSMEIRVEQSKKYQAGRLSAQEVESAKETSAYRLDAFEAKVIKNNVFAQLKDDIKSMRIELDSVTDQNSGGLQRFNDMMRTAEAHYSAEMALTGVTEKEQRDYESAKNAQEQLYNLKKKLVKLEAEGKTDDELSRHIKEQNERYEASINVLASEEHIANILEREVALEKELANVKQKAEFDQAEKTRIENEKKKSEESKKFSSQLRSYYSEWMKILNEINNLESQMNDLQLKDKGTGLYANRIQDAQDLKSSKVADLRVLEDTINKTLSFDGAKQTGGFNAYLEYCRENAILTADEIQNLNKALMKSEYIEQDFNIESAKQQRVEQKKQYEELLKLQKQYNEADYQWHKADISGDDKSPYNKQMESYWQRMQTIRQNIVLTAEQEVELNKINYDHIKKKTKLVNDTASADQQYAQQLNDITSKVYSQIDAWYDDNSFGKIFSHDLTKEIEEFLDKLSSIDKNTNFSKLNKEWDGIISKTKAAAKAKDEYITSKWKDRFQSEYTYANGKTIQDQGILDHMADLYRQEEEESDQKAKEAEQKAKEFNDNIGSIYDRLMKTTKEINSADDKINRLTLKDGGTGLYAESIQSLRDQKSYLVSDLRSINNEIVSTMSFDGIDASNPIMSFFDDVRVKAVLTAEEVEKFQSILKEMTDKSFGFKENLAAQIQPFVEKLQSLKQMVADGIIDKNSASALSVLQADSLYSQKWGAFAKNPDALNAADVLQFVSANKEYISSLEKAAAKESEYFANKKQYANISNMQDFDSMSSGIDKVSNSTNRAKENLEQFVAEFTNGRGIITGFTTDANGISKINFSVLEEGTNHFRTFSAEVGQFTNNVYTVETSMKNMTSGTQAAEKALASMSQVMSRFNSYGLTVDNNEHVNDLYEKMQELSQELKSKASSKDVGDQSSLQATATGAERLIKILTTLEKSYLNVKDALDSGDADPTGKKILQNEDAYSKMVQIANDIAASMPGSTIEIGKFNEKAKQLPYVIETADGQVKSFIMTMEGLDGAVVTSLKTVDKAKTGWQKFTGSFGGLGKSILQYGMSLIGIYDIVRYVRQGFNEVREIDTAMTELKKVTDETSVAYDNFLKTVSKTAGAVGSTVKDLTASAADWARLGYSLEEAGELAKNTMILMNVSEFDNVADATDSLISSLQAFKDEGASASEYSMKIIDEINQIGNSYAISTSDLASSLTRSSAALVAANNSLEESIALTTAANTVIQDPDSVGNALKVISMRIRGVKTELEDAGEETEGVVENTAKLQEKVMALTNIDGSGGVDILTNSGEFKSTYEILLAISKVWDKMNDMDQAALLEIIAGKQRGSVVAGLLQNGDIMESVYASASNADGSAAKELETYLDSIEGKVQTLTNSLQTLWVNTLDSDLVKLFIDLLNVIVQATDKMGLFNTAIAAYLAKTAFSSKKFGIGNILAGIPSVASAASAAMTKLGVSSKAAAIGFNIFNSAATMGISLLAGAAISALVKYIDKVHQTAEEMKEAANEVVDTYKSAQESLSSNKATIDDIADDYEKLSSGVDKFGNNISLTTDEYKRYNEIVNKIADMFPTMVTGYTAEGNAILSTKGNVEALTKAYQEQAEAARNAIILGGDAVFADAENDIKDIEDQIDAYNVAVKMARGQTIEDAKSQYGDSVVHDAIEVLKEYGFEENYNKYASGDMSKTYGLATKWDKKTQSYVNDYTYDDEIEHAQRVNKLMMGRNNLLAEQQGALSKVNTVLQAYLDSNSKYVDMEEETKSAISSIVSALDPADFDYDDDKMEASILSSIINPIHENQDGVQDALNNLIAIDEDAISYQVYEGLKAALLTAITNLPVETQDAFKNAFGLDGDSDYGTYLNRAKDILQDEYDSMASDLTLSDLKIVDSLDVPDGVLLTWDELKQKIEEVKSTLVSDVNSVKTYSALVESIDAYNDILTQTSEIVTNNTEVTQEYKDALIEMGISEEDLSECFDENNGLVVKNAKKLNDLVKSSNKNVAANVKLAKSQARLDYYDLYKQMYQLSQGSGKLTGATLAEVNALYVQMNAIEKTIYKYSLLEEQLLGATNAFNEFEKAQEIDSETDYIGSVESMIEALGAAFNTAELGSETAQAAIAGLVPESVYADLDTVDEKMDAIYKYFKKGKLSMYFDVQFDKDGKIEAVEMKLGNLRKFIEDGLANGAFIGDNWQHFDLSEDIKTLDDLAEKMEVTKEVALAFVKSLEDHDIEWLNGDYSTLFDKLIPDSSTIQALKKQMQEEFSDANVDLTLRPQVSWEKMNKAHWDVPEGSYSTVNTVTYMASDFGLSDEDGNDYAINVTPILPNGDVIDKREDGNGLYDYIMGKINSGESIEDLDIFLGAYKTVEEACDAAELLHKYQEDYYAALKSYSLENDIYENISSLADLEYQLANGKITVEDYAKKMYGLNGLWQSGQIEQDEYTTALKNLDEQLESGKITAEEYNLAFYGISSESEALAETARDEALAWYEKTEKLNEYKAQLEDYYEQLEAGKDSEGNIIDADQVQQDIDEVSGEISKLLVDLSLLEEPTDVVLQFAIDDITKDLTQITDKIGEVIEGTHYQFNVEAGEYQVILDKNDPNYQEIMNYVDLLNEQYTLSLHMGKETTTVTDQLQNIADILGKITKILSKVYNIDVETGDALTKTRTLKDVIDSIKSKTVTISTKIKDTISGWFNANGTAHASGSAHATGSWGLPQSEHNSLVGELGPELVVNPKTGRYYTVGDRGAEMVDLPKGAIIFNHKQTESLLKNGYVTSRGKAYAEGNAHVTIYPTGSSKDQWKGTGYSGPNDSTYDAAEALSDAASSASDAADEFREVFDWIEVRLEEITENLDLKNAKLENAIGFDKQNKVIDEMIELNQALYNNLIAGANKYYDYAKKLLAKIPSAYREAAQDGTIAIEEFVGKTDEKTLEAIKEYREWVQKGADATQQAEETLTEISALAKQAIDNISQDFENKASLNDNKIDQLEAYNALLETDQGFESEKIYQELIKVNNANIEQLKKQRKEMQAELDAQVKAGNIKKYSQDWYDAVNAIAEVDTEIIELTTDTENYQDAINELHWDKFDALVSRLEAVSNETENLIDILSSKDLVDEVGNWTDEGITTLGLYAQQMEVAEVQAKKYQEEIAYLNENWQKLGYTEEEYIEKLEDLKDGQYDSIKAYHDAKDAIVDLNKERVDAVKDGIQKEIDAYEELIQKQKEQLNVEKDLHDFQKSIMEQEKDVADLRRQLAALAGDNSASARAKRAQLEAELAKAQADLEESYYERSLQNKQDALDKELENYQDEKDAEMEALDEYLENAEQVVSDSLTTIQANTDTVYKTLTAMGEEYSLSITEALTSPWKEGEYAIQSFSEQFGISMSATIAELEELELKFKDIMAEIEHTGTESVSDVKDNAQEYTQAEYKAPSSGGSGGSGSSGGNSGSSNAGLVSSLSGNIKYGDKGTNVKKLQQALNALGYGNSGTKSTDGIFGKQTLSAVKKFQKDMGVSADGIVGPKTKEKFKLKGYAVGSISVSKDQLAILDELGDELQLVPGKNGRLAYVKKGTGIVPADLTERLMNLAMDPQGMLDQNRPSVGVSPEIHNTEINLNITYGDMVSIGEYNGNNLADIEKMVAKQFDKHTKDLNNALRKYVR